MNNQRIYYINNFYKIANELSQEITDEKEVEKIDQTELFKKELRLMIKHGELIIIEIKGKVRLGKSTLAMALGKFVFELLKENKQQKKDAKFGIRNIARDQQEYSKIMRNPETMYTIIVTDEDNELEKGGENSTTEQALNRVFSDVQAGRYVHRINCSPKEIIDANSDIILEVLSQDKKRKDTHCKLYYRMNKAGNELIQLLGYVDIYVGDVIKNWDNEVKKHFLKPKKNKKDIEIIEKYRKKDWYVEYMVKKYEKMELITKEGIFQPRKLNYAEMIKQTIEELKPLTKIGNVLNKNMVRSTIKTKAKNMKIPLSIIGEALSTDEALAVLELYKSFHKLNTELTKNKKAFRDGKILHPDFKVKDKIIEESKNKIGNSLEILEGELNKYIEIKSKYDEGR